MKDETYSAISDLYNLIESQKNGEITAIQLSDLFWDKIWLRGDFVKDFHDNPPYPITDEVFYTFENFVEDPSLIDEDSHDIGEEEFIRRCREFLPKLKELANQTSNE